MEPPFTRTHCACAECVDCCKQQPGSLAPGDFERITAFLNVSPETAAKYFWASPGALVMNAYSGHTFRVGTITPRYEHGRCVFLDEADRCRIHAVAPYGCAYFDIHMDLQTGQERGAWSVRQIMDSDAYNRLRDALPIATHYNPRRA